MYKVTIKQTKLKPETLFFSDYHKFPADYDDYITETFIKTGKLLSRKRFYGEDRMTVTYTLEWQSKADWLEFLTDEYRHNNSSQAFNYDETHGISSEVTIERIE